MRNGPNATFPSRRRHYHLFDGDGMLHEVYFKGGKIFYSNQYVLTRRHLEEKAAGRPLFMTIGSLAASTYGIVLGVLNSLWSKLRYGAGSFFGTANTSVEFFNRRLLALVENDAPHIVSVPSLRTVGVERFRGTLKHPMTAHPKVCPKTGELVFFAYSLAPPFVTMSVANPDGSKVEDFVLPGVKRSAMIHDFAITENYSVLPLFPMYLTLAGPFSDRNFVTHDSNDKIRFAVLPRHATSPDQGNRLRMITLLYESTMPLSLFIMGHLICLEKDRLQQCQIVISA